MRKIVQGVKDESGSYIKETPVSVAVEDVTVVDLSLDSFMEKYLHLLHRETKALFLEAAQGKLSRDSSQSMRDNLKLIMELKKQEKQLLDNLTDDELKKLAKKYK